MHVDDTIPRIQAILEASQRLEAKPKDNLPGWFSCTAEGKRFPSIAKKGGSGGPTKAGAKKSAGKASDQDVITDAELYDEGIAETWKRMT